MATALTLSTPYVAATGPAAGATTAGAKGRKDGAAAATRVALAMSGPAWAGRAKAATRPPVATKTAEVRIAGSVAPATTCEISASGL